MPVAIVSGATYGIGRGVAAALVRAGYAVAGFGVGADDVAAARAELAGAGRSLVEEVDITEPEQVDAFVARVVSELGAPSLLVNNAGIRPTGTALETTVEEWDRIFAVNLRGMFVLTRAALRPMIDGGGGCIVNMASTSGYGGEGHLAYCASKGAVIPLTRSLAIDHGGDGVRVNAIVPGFVVTGMTERWPPEVHELAAGLAPAKRTTTPDDIAEAVMFLASAENLSGQVLEIGVSPFSMAPRGPE